MTKHKASREGACGGCVGRRSWLQQARGCWKCCNSRLADTRCLLLTQLQPTFGASDGCSCCFRMLPEPLLQDRQQGCMHPLQGQGSMGWVAMLPGSGASQL